MKKVILMLMALTALAAAGWFGSNSAKAEPMLEPTPFKAIEPQIGKVPLMLEFGSVHCYSCQLMDKILYKIKQKYPKANIYFVDIYKDMAAAKKFGISIIPTQKFLDASGNIVDTHMGPIGQAVLEKKLKSLQIIKDK